MQFWHRHQEVLKQCEWNQNAGDGKKQKMLKERFLVPDEVLHLFNNHDPNQQRRPAAGQDSLQPFLVAYACSSISLIVFASTALKAEIDEKVAKLPAMDRDESVGNARLALIGITDLHKQLSRVGTSSGQACHEPHPDGGSDQPPGSAAQAAEEHPLACMRTHNKLDVARQAMVKAADRLVMHAHYMHCPGLYTHQRLVAAVVQPHGPLRKGEGDALADLLRFFKGLPEELFQDPLHGFSRDPDDTEDREAFRVRVVVCRNFHLELSCKAVTGTLRKPFNELVYIQICPVGTIFFLQPHRLA